LPPGSSGQPSVSAAVSSCSEALAALWKLYQDDFGSSGYDAHTFVDFVVASLFKPESGLAAWYDERHRAIQSELATIAGLRS
jgi:hypothetical protein